MRVVVVPHTHWDREWYRPYQEFRLALVAALDELLDAFTAGENLAPVTLDGQTILLDDYLECALARGRTAPPRGGGAPADRSVVRAAATSSWSAAKRWCATCCAAGVTLLASGPSMAVGYLADQFGHIAQMPQILRGFGIGSAAFWRGRDRDAGKNDFWWQAPDGSRVLALHLSDSYGNACAVAPGPVYAGPAHPRDLRCPGRRGRRAGPPADERHGPPALPDRPARRAGGGQAAAVPRLCRGVGQPGRLRRRGGTRRAAGGPGRGGG